MATAAARAPAPNDVNGDGVPDHAAFVDTLDDDQLAYLERIMGVDHPPTLDTTQETAPPQGLGQSVLQAFAGNENRQQVAPQSATEGFVGGLSRGLGSAGTRSQMQRAKVEAQVADRQAKTDAANQRATAEYRAGKRAVATMVGQAALSRDKKPTPAEIRADAKARAQGTAEGTPAENKITLDSGELTPAGLDAAARAYAISGQLPPMGMGKNPLRAKIINRAAELGGPDFNPAANKADLASEQASLSNLTKQHTSMTAYGETANKNADLMLRFANKIPDTGSPLINSLVRGPMQRVLGNKEIAEFNTALSTVQPEFARILTQGPTGSGPLSDSARHELQAVIDGNFTRKQLFAALAVLKQDAKNRTKSYQDAIDETKARIRTIGQPSTRPPLTSFGSP